MHLSVQIFLNLTFSLPTSIPLVQVVCGVCSCMENLSCQLRFSCGSSLDKRSSTREDVCRCHTPIESVSGGAYYCCYKEETSPLLLQSSVSFNRPYNNLGIAPCRIYEIHYAFFVNCFMLDRKLAHLDIVY